MTFFKNFNKKANFFVKRSLLGGVLFLAPLTILFLIFKWIFGIVSSGIQPFTNFFIQFITLPEIVIDIFVMSLIFFLCFIIGVVFNTALGKFMHDILFVWFQKVPGYKTIRDILEQFMNTDSDRSFSQAVLVKSFGENNLVLGLLNGSYTLNGQKYYVVFVPTSPNPTSGFPIHIHEDNLVEFLDCSIEEAMKIIISCGSGVNKIIK